MKDKIKYYYYRTYKNAKGTDYYIMSVTQGGVTIEFKNGEMLDTGIVPSKIHLNKSKLSPRDIEDFHRYINYKEFKLGRLYSKEEYKMIKKTYQQFLKKNPK